MAAARTGTEIFNQLIPAPSEEALEQVRLAMTQYPSHQFVAQEEYNLITPSTRQGITRGKLLYFVAFNF